MTAENSILGLEPGAQDSWAFRAAAGALLVLMAVLAGGAALRESAAFDEVAHIGAGLSYVQKLDMRLNDEHPPLAKLISGLPLALRGTRADYSSVFWTSSGANPGVALFTEWGFGDWLLVHWNDPVTTLRWARAPMLLLGLVMGWALYWCACRLGGPWGGLLVLSLYVTAPVILAFAPLVLTDFAVTLFILLALWMFAEIWQKPSGRNVLLFALSLAAALLSKFSSGLLFLVFPAFALSTRWRPVTGQPASKLEARVWRRLRRRATAKGILWAALIVYAFYLFLSWNQPTESMMFGHGPHSALLRRLLMPVWLYVWGLLAVVFQLSRPTYLLGHAYSHGVWFYYPVLFVLKSAPGSIGLLLLAAIIALRRRMQSRKTAAAAVPAEATTHWRVLWVGLIVFAGVCVLTPLNIGMRHFSVPMVLIMLLAAPLPRMIGEMWESSPAMARGLAAFAFLLVASCLFTAARAYPYYVPYTSVFGLGHPGYFLVNGANLDWNQSLPEVERFVQQHGLQKVELDAYGLMETSATVPQSRLWNCQNPTTDDRGQWVVVSANMILDARACGWLLNYPQEVLAGGSMYAFHLSDEIPPAGSPGGPPLPSEYRDFLGAAPGRDIRQMFVGVMENPEKMPELMARMQAEWQESHPPAHKAR